MNAPFLILETGQPVASMRRHGGFPHWIRVAAGLERDATVAVNVERGDELPHHAGFSGVLITGSAAMVTDRHAWSERSAEWLRDAAHAGVPLFGICYGHQLLAHALGGEVGDIVAEELGKQNHALNQAERKQLVGDVLDELLGLGPIEPLLKDPTITDILVNGHSRVFVERYGVLEPTPVRFKDERHLLRIIQKIVSAVGRRIDESSPMVDARLADGSRVNAVVPPLAIDGSSLSIRKFSRVPISMDRMIEIGSVSPVITVERQELRNRNTMTTARMAPSISMFCTAWKESLHRLGHCRPRPRISTAPSGSSSMRMIWAVRLSSLPAS